jgi:hypothetical protein
MSCGEIEILICDYVDGTLAPAARAEVERHLAECPACAELARDSAAAMEFIGRVADVEPPPELITRLLFDAPWSRDKAKSKARAWVAALLSPILQPRFAMSMAFTILSLAMLAHLLMGGFRQPTLADLEPARIWAGIEQSAYRAWARTEKYYDNLKVVYQIQTTLREWQQQNEEQQSAPAQDAPGHSTDDRKLPVRPAPEPDTRPGAAPETNPPGGIR